MCLSQSPHVSPLPAGPPSICSPVSMCQLQSLHASPLPAVSTLGFILPPDTLHISVIGHHWPWGGDLGSQFPFTCKILGVICRERKFEGIYNLLIVPDSSVDSNLYYCASMLKLDVSGQRAHIKRGCYKNIIQCIPFSGLYPAKQQE